MTTMSHKEHPANPNNCDACDYKKMSDEGWCYMFREKPVDICMQHTERKAFSLYDTSRQSTIDVSCRRTIEGI